MSNAATPHSTLVFEQRTLTGAAQQQRGRQLAQGLRSLGLAEGDVLAVFLRNGIEYADVVHACRIAGIYYCPVNWHFTEIGRAHV